MMHAEFASVVDPIFERALQIIEALEQGELLAPQVIQGQLLNLFDRADMLLGTQLKWQWSKYALAAWIDEMILSTPWDGVAWWRDHILEMEFFQTRLCSVRFYELARQASALGDRDALEVFVNCVQLGFRGALDLPTAANPSHDPLSTQRHPGSTVPQTPAYPETVQQWLRQMEPRLDVHSYSTRVPVTAQYPQRIVPGAPPLPAKMQVIWWSLAAAVLLLANGWAIQSWRLN